MKMSKYAFIFSIVLTIAGIITLSAFGLNYGVDFQAGSNVDVKLSKNVTKAEIEPLLDKIHLSDGATVAPGDKRVNIRFTKELNEDQSEHLKSAIQELDKTASFEINTVDTEMAKELGRNAIYS